MIKKEECKECGGEKIIVGVNNIISLSGSPAKREITLKCEKCRLITKHA